MGEPAFDLDYALALYLRALAKDRRLVSREDKEEMESHLRDEIDDLVACGHTPREAFARATAGFGDAATLRAEYDKLHKGRPLAQIANVSTYYFDRRIVMRLLTGAFLGAFFMLGGLMLEGGHIASITQMTAFFIAAGGALGALIIAYPARMVWKSFVLALTGREATRSDYLDAARVFRSYGDMAILAGFVGVIFGTVHVLENLDKPDTIGPGVAVALISILYGLLLKLFIGKSLADAFQARAYPSVAVLDEREAA